MIKLDVIYIPMAVHVRCNSLYISLPPFGKQQREMTMLCVFSFETKRWRF